MKKSWVLLAVLALTFAATACLPPPYPPEGPHAVPGGPGPGISSGEARMVARDAVQDLIFRRYGRDAMPRVSANRVRTIGRNEAEVMGTVTFYRGPRVRVRQNFRCRVDRFNRSVRGVDLF
jgi:hypothetical protein